MKNDAINVKNKHVTQTKKRKTFLYLRLGILSSENAEICLLEMLILVHFLTGFRVYRPTWSVAGQ